MPSRRRNTEPCQLVRRKRFCSPACRSRFQGAQFRERKRALSDTDAVLHPGEIQRPFRTDESEPDWLTAELAPPRLACEPAPEPPEPRTPFWRLD
jgi:hypothetical protein